MIVVPAGDSALKKRDKHQPQWAEGFDLLCTRLGHLLLGLVLVQAYGEPEHNFPHICTNVMSFELFDGRNKYFEWIADTR